MYFLLRMIRPESFSLVCYYLVEGCIKTSDKAIRLLISAAHLQLLVYHLFRLQPKQYYPRNMSPYYFQTLPIHHHTTVYIPPWSKNNDAGMMVLYIYHHLRIMILDSFVLPINIMPYSNFM